MNKITPGQSRLTVDITGCPNRRKGRRVLFCFYVALVVVSSLAVMSTVIPNLIATLSASEAQPVSVNANTSEWLLDGSTSARIIARAIIFDTYSYQLSVTPPSQTIMQGQTAVYIVSVTLVSGGSQPTQLTVSSVPSGLTASLGQHIRNTKLSNSIDYYRLEFGSAWDIYNGGRCSVGQRRWN